ncbi:MAG: DUF5652 family protein [Candidatus Levyibacteriota bacterium]
MDLSFLPNFLVYILFIWEIIWKGIALWRAAHLNQRNWFVVMLVLVLIINTFGILEIAYLFYFAKKRLTLAEVQQWKNVFIKHVPEKK